MPTLRVEYQGRDYSSVDAYLFDLTIDVKEKLVDNRAKKRRFREQLRTYKKMWEVWTTADEEIRKRCWKPPMERPEFLLEHILNVFSDSYNTQNAPKMEVRRLAGCYSLLAFIHDRELSHLNRINNNIIVSPEIIEQTLAAPRNMIGGGGIDRTRKDEEIAEMYLIEEHYNRVRVDIKEHCERGTGTQKAENLAETKKIKNAKTLSNVDLFDETARRFKDRSIKPLRKDETWYDLDRSLKPWFDLAIQCLHQEGKTKGIGLLQYEYKNLLHYARGINIKVCQGNLFDLARKQADELAKKFRDIAREFEKDSLAEGAATKAHAGRPTETKHSVETQENDGQVKTDMPDYREFTKVPVLKLIEYGEGHTLEFKETLEYDMRQNQYNKNLNKECLKTIAAFLNTDGGILLIGVKDNGKVTGIERDLQYVQRKNLDGFELKLRNLIRDRFDLAPFNQVRIKCEELETGTICRVNVDPVNRPQVIHLDKEVYIRDGNTTLKLDGRNLTNWIQQRGQN